MKKILLLLAAALCVVSVTPSCSKKPDATKEKSDKAKALQEDE
ncbi:MAG: hypothetical protein JWO82_4265 [Akkermansiaceae bacterium]|nr:hypothetical protein [Akkermansiaceae bacterium]